MSAGLLDIRNLIVPRGPIDIIRGVTFGVAAAERIALVGPNAAGKSTLLAAIAGLLTPTAGEIHLGQRPLSQLRGRDLARQVALVVALQDSAPTLTVRESAELGRYPHTGPFQALGTHDHEAVSLALAETGLHDLALRALGSLSAGERQRALVARALAQEPKLLLLDEPSAHLDIGHGLDLFALLTTIAAGGVAIIAVVHDLVAAAQWAARMIVMSEGRIVDDGPPEVVMRGDALGRAFGVSIAEARTKDEVDASTWRFKRA